MSSIEFIGFLFIFALVTFVSILRRRLRGSDREWTATCEAEDSETSGPSVDAPEPTADESRRPAHPHGGFLPSVVKRKLIELVDGLHPAPKELRAGFPTTTSYAEPRSAKLPEPLRPPAPPAVNDGPIEKTAPIGAPPVGDAEGFRRALRDGNSIRRAIIMKELLDRPVVMRGPAIARRLRR